MRMRMRSFENPANEFSSRCCFLCFSQNERGRLVALWSTVKRGFAEISGNRGKDTASWCTVYVYYCWRSTAKDGLLASGKSGAKRLWTVFRDAAPGEKAKPKV